MEIYGKNSLPGNRLFYSVSYKGTPVVLESALGITLWTDNKTFSITDTREVGRRQQDTAWTPLCGERSHCRDHYNEMGPSTAQSIKMVDFAVKRNLLYIHLDAGWYGYEYSLSSDATDVAEAKKSFLDISKVVEHARKNGIGVFLYVNQRALAKQLDVILLLYQKWGISGIFGLYQRGKRQGPEI